MATRYGSDRSFLSTNTGGVYDTDGNEVVSSSNQFGSFPLGPAALAQTLFSVPNGTFNLLPPVLDDPIGPSNPLPYWDIPFDNSENLMSSQVIFDTTTNTYALRLTPGSALSGDTYAITTRSAVISDDNLALRQKAIATLEKVGTYAGATQVNLSLSATYYDALGSAISTQAIGTVFDNGTVSSITGFTTAGTAAVGISASYVDLTFTMTATANVTSGISFDVNTILLQTSQGAGGGQSFLVTESFTSSTTWVRPTGVEYLIAVIGVGGGGGGGGAHGTARQATQYATGGGGGGAARWGYLKDLYVGNVGSVSIGVGAAGAGGAGVTYANTNGTPTSTTMGTATAGGNTTFGAYLTVPGGGAGAAGVNGGNSAPVSGGAGGTAGGTITTSEYGPESLVSGAGGRGGTVVAGPPATVGAGTAGAAGSATLYSSLPYTTGLTAGSAGVAGSVVLLGQLQSSATSTAGTAAAAGITGGAGGGGAAISVTSSDTVSCSVGGVGGGNGGGGGGGAVSGLRLSAGTGWRVVGGNGGRGGLGAGGGGGGPAVIAIGGAASELTNSRGTATGGSGGSGGTGFVIIAYIG
jgi:hypothetical protein